MNILEELANTARERVKKDKESVSLERMKEFAREMTNASDVACSVGSAYSGKAFYDAVSREGLSFICEIKKASPSKGIIDPEFDYLKIAADYEAAGADCMSCLTEPSRFLGSDEIFKSVRAAVKTPMIRKDFTIEEYQIYQAKAMGANCVLLICSLLDEKTLSEYLKICDELGLAALTETHDGEEIKKAVSSGAKMIGVNNRNLKDFSVDFENAAKLRDMIPAGTLYVAESGVKSVDDLKLLNSIGADAVLMGEVLMRAEDRIARLNEFKAAVRL